MCECFLLPLTDGAHAHAWIANPPQQLPEHGAWARMESLTTLQFHVHVQVQQCSITILRMV